MSNRKPFIRPGYARCVECGCEVPDNPDAVNACERCVAGWEADLAADLLLARQERASRARRMATARWRRVPED